MEFLGTNFIEIQMKKISNIFIQENASENVVMIRKKELHCEMNDGSISLMIFHLQYQYHGKFVFL